MDQLLQDGALILGAVVTVVGLGVSLRAKARVMSSPADPGDDAVRQMRLGTGIATIGAAVALLGVVADSSIYLALGLAAILSLTGILTIRRAL